MAFSFDLGGLPENGEEAFAVFEERAREKLNVELQNDRRYNSDQNDFYIGSYEPERSYVTAILAFLDEYSISADIEDISELENEEFFKQFGRFKSKVEYVSTRFELRKQRENSGAIGTIIILSPDYKAKVGDLLSTIRKIVNQEVAESQKKENIFKKIAALQSEVDRDRTTVDAAFGRLLQLTKAVKEGAEDIKPAIDQLERLKKLFWEGSAEVENLPKPDRPKALPKADEPKSGHDDEIPF